MGWSFGSIIHLVLKDEWAVCTEVTFYTPDTKFNAWWNTNILSMITNERTNQLTITTKNSHDLWNFCCHSPLLQSFRTQTLTRTKCLSCSFPISTRNHAKFPLTYHLHHFSSSQSVRMNRLIVQQSWCRSHKCKSQANTNANGTKYKRLMSINGIKACLFPCC